MNAFELLNDWKNNIKNAKFLEYIKVSDKETFCFEDIIVNSMNYISINDCYEVNFKKNDFNGMLTIRHLHSESTTILNQCKIDEEGSMIIVRDVGNMLSVTISNNKSGLFVLIHGAEGSLITLD